MEIKDESKKRGDEILDDFDDSDDDRQSSVCISSDNVRFEIKLYLYIEKKKV